MQALRETVPPDGVASNIVVQKQDQRRDRIVARVTPAASPHWRPRDRLAALDIQIRLSAVDMPMHHALSRGVAWGVVLSMSMQGFAFAVTRTSGPAHFHLANLSGSPSAPHSDHEHEHEHEHQHESLIEHHHHDASDQSAVYVDGETEGATDRTGVTPKRIVFDLDSLLVAALPVTASPSIPMACCFLPYPFTSRIAEPLERPPR